MTLAWTNACFEFYILQNLALTFNFVILSICNKDALTLGPFEQLNLIISPANSNIDHRNWSVRISNWQTLILGQCLVSAGLSSKPNNWTIARWFRILWSLIWVLHNCFSDIWIYLGIGHLLWDWSSSESICTVSTDIL